MIDLSLIYLYKSIISNFALRWTFNDGTSLTNDKNHLLLLLMVRYCSLIIISASIDLLTEIYTTFEIFIGDDYLYKNKENWTIIAGAFELFDVTTYVFVIFLSFSINNLLYERYCFCCHNAVYGSVHKLISKRNGSTGDGYIMMLDQNDDIDKQSMYSNSGGGGGGGAGEIIKHSNSNILNDLDDLNSVNTNSSRRETNYFDDNLYVT